MAANCPHCNEPIEKLTGFVPEATLRERLKNQAAAKDAEITALSSRLTELEGKTTGYDAIVGERDTLKAELTGLRQRGERTAALAELKLDAGLLEHVEVLYNSAVAGQDEPPDFKTWLGEQGKAHPLLAPHVGRAGAAGAGGTGAGAGAGAGTGAGAASGGAGGAGAGAGAGSASRLPDTAPGSDPAGPGGKMTPEQVRAYFASAEYAALPRDAKKAKIAELKGVTAKSGAAAG